MFKICIISVGMWAVWIATGLSWGLTAFMAFLRYRKGIGKTTMYVKKD